MKTFCVSGTFIEILSKILRFKKFIFLPHITTKGEIHKTHPISIPGTKLKNSVSL
jgi:hypothetical protein